MTSHDDASAGRDEHLRDLDDTCPAVERTGVLADPDPTPSPAARERLREALDDLSRVRSTSLAPLLRAKPVTDGYALTHRVPSGALELDRVRAQAPLRAGHVLAVGLALCESLAALHEAALAHGDVSAERVLVGPDGRARLTGTGLAWSYAPGMLGGPTPEDDVRAVGDLVRDLLGRSGAPSALVLAALRASDPDPALRPTIRDLQALLTRAGTPEPLLDLLWMTAPRSDSASDVGRRAVVVEPGAPAEAAASPIPWPEPGHTPTPTAPPRRGTSRRRPPRPATARPSGRRVPPIAIVVAIAAVVVLAGLLRSGTGTAWSANATPPSAAPTTASSGGATGSATSGHPSPPEVTDLDLDRAATSGPDWRATLDALDAGRARALGAASVGDLAGYVAQGSRAWAQDSALVTRIAASGARLVGGGLVVLEVRTVSTSSTSATLLVRDRREPYQVVTRSGTIARPARVPRWWRVQLLRAEGRWRFVDVAESAAPARS